MKQLKFLQPLPPPFTYEEWKTQPFPERLRMLCVAWATQGYGSPASIYVFYLLKIGIYVGMWGFFCSFHDALGGWGTVETWWFKVEAIQIAVIWSILFEILGLGCGSGALTGRYMPPFGGFLYWLRPGTIKLPFFPKAPLIGGDSRNLLDILLYFAFLLLLVRALIAPEIIMEHILPVVVLLPILGIIDKTLYLAARSEHYLIALACFLFPADTLPALKIVWLAIWWGAATSKLNLHFPGVVDVMISNHAVLRFKGLRKKLYKDYPNDLRPSTLSAVLAHLGTATEYLFPLVLLMSTGGELTTITLIVMFSFHLYITSSIPMGVPLEWNVIMVYGAFVLFGTHADVWAFSVQDPILITILGGSLLLLPILGNLFPERISFLLSMRYYAGNWAYSAWLFKGDAEGKLDEKITKVSQTVGKQLDGFYEKSVSELLISKVIAFRHMHLHGRALHELIPKAVDDIEEYTYRDGELVAGVVLGWNFGEGHLHGTQLLSSIQRRCQFESGDLRCIMVESQPLFKPYMAWKIVDAKDGVIETGKTNVKALLDLQPWPTE
ncbi:MAG: DUF3556 domain-containing protein [Saprospiraceae bacterium]|nr:DUF3556 domain-containing protein [Saprospiraceae bacterium]